VNKEKLGEFAKQRKSMYRVNCSILLIKIEKIPYMDSLDKNKENSTPND
jgi:hypothetical protein